MSEEMPDRFPAAVVTGWNKVEVKEIPGFPIGPYDALCRIEACSTCAATDNHLIDGSFPREWFCEPPFVLGHESVGRVVEVGPKVRRFKKGQLVLRAWWSPPGGTVDGLGSAWGGFSTWGIARDTRSFSQDTGNPVEAPYLNCMVVPEMPVSDATLFITWRDAMSCLLQAGAKAGDRIVVFGSGGNGLSFVRFATLLGAKVVMVGSPRRFDLAAKLGAVACVDYRKGDSVVGAVREALGQGADLAIEAVGTSGHSAQMIGSLAEKGKIFMFGIPDNLQFPANLYSGPSEFTIVRKACDEWQAHGHVLGYYLSGEIDPSDFLNGEVPLERVGEALDAVKRRDAIKIAVRMG